MTTRYLLQRGRFIGSYYNWHTVRCFFDLDEAKEQFVLMTTSPKNNTNWCITREDMNEQSFQCIKTAIALYNFDERQTFYYSTEDVQIIFTHYIIRKGMRETHDSGISSISWLNWELFEVSKLEHAKSFFNNMAKKEGENWQLVRVETVRDRFKTTTQEFVEEEINPFGMAEAEKTNWLFKVQKDVLVDGRIAPQVPSTFPSQTAAEKYLLELLRTDETSAGCYSIRRVEMREALVAQYKKG